MWLGIRVSSSNPASSCSGQPIDGGKILGSGVAPDGAAVAIERPGRSNIFEVARVDEGPGEVAVVPT